MKNKRANSFLHELSRIGKEKQKPQSFETLDLSELDNVPPKKKDYKKVFSTVKYRNRKK